MFHFFADVASVGVDFSCILFLSLHNAAAQLQVCSEPFQSMIALVPNVTFLSTTCLDSDPVYYTKVLHFKEEDAEREADTNGLDLTNVEPNEQGQRTLGNASLVPRSRPAFHPWVGAGNEGNAKF